MHADVYRVRARPAGTLALLLLTSVTFCAQQASSPAFDVFTVKPHAASDGHMDWYDGKESFRANNVTLLSFLANAWGLRQDQVAGAPAWLEELHWDMAGKVTDADAAAVQQLSREQMRAMRQQFLRDRFHLRAHLETRTGPVYDMTVAKGGTRLQTLAPGVDGTPPKRGGFSMRSTGGALTLKAEGVPMDMLVRSVAGSLHRSVVDRTQLPTGALYAFTLRYAQETGLGASSETDALPLREAMEDQLGLHLEPARGPVETLVIDAVEKPAEN